MSAVPPQEIEDPQQDDRGLLALLVVALLLGSALRFAWGADIEYKQDERYTTESALGLGGKSPWPALGMPSSAGPRNAGMSVWVFSALARLTGAGDPIGLARSVEGLNVLALAVLAGFAWRAVPRDQRAIWAWAIALAAVSPTEVIHSRKIWAQSVLPLFSALNWIGWWYRRTPAGAFCWGLIGAFTGQIHMSGFIFTAALMLWTLAFDRTDPSPIRWRYWAAGTLVGALPMIPWAIYLVQSAGTRPKGGTDDIVSVKINDIIKLRYWLLWAGKPFGADIVFSLKRAPFVDFLRSPAVAGRATYAALATYAVLGIVLMRAVVAFGRELSRARPSALRRLWSTGSNLSLLMGASFWGYGTLITLAPNPVHTFYCIITFPGPYLWLPALLLGGVVARVTGRRMLLVTFCASALLSFLFLLHVHRSGGIPGSDFGVPYGRQIGLSQ